MSLTMDKDFEVGSMKCSSNNLCKVSNCDRIRKSRQVQKSHSKWCKGAVWITIPPSGYKCQNTKFTGCNCKKTWQETEYYYVDRNAVCQHNEQTSVKVADNGDFSLKIDSLLNNCAYVSQDVGRCKADIMLKTSAVTESGNNKDNVAIVSKGKITFDVIMNGTQRTIGYPMNMTRSTTYTSKYSNVFFINKGDFATKFSKAMDKQMYAAAR